MIKFALGFALASIIALGVAVYMLGPQSLLAALHLMPPITAAYAYLPDATSSLDTATAGATTTQSYECNQDASLCPDGSSVGRTGADCHFAACPASNATSTALHTTVGQKVTGLSVTVTPEEVTQDSRCPKDVQCIWAGTVKVRTKVASTNGMSEINLELGSATSTDGIRIVLDDVAPEKTSGDAIPDSSYRFTFLVSK